ncbi:hypothetical protein K4F52_003503 [Lecanicillium sp. MT-2017a]|nr:hypothetical protein K4F52_003503 [Lecanicillium sp. MT-2017a]
MVHVEVESSQDSDSATVIMARLLIPGRGEPVTNGALAIVDDKIEWVGTMFDIPAKYSKVKKSYVPVIMPGLWDCHVHYMGVDVAGGLDSLMSLLPNSPALIGAITAEDLKTTLMAGYTTVRELGGYANDLWPGVETGYLVGPNIYSAVAPLSMTGGHADDHTTPLPAVLDAMNHGATPLAVCDGVEDCIKTVRKMVRRGARVIKVCSSGGVLSLNDDPEDRQFSDEELKAIVEEAGRTRRAVAAHAIGKAGIMAGLRAGVKSIEHGMFLDEEVADVMIKQDAIFVGTQHIVRTLASDYLDKLPEKNRRKVLALQEQARKSYRLAVSKGVKMAMGTDMLSSDRKSKLSHGNNAHEMEYAVELGMTPLQAIECATANGPETLGAMAPMSGQIKVGYDADIIAVKSSPLDDIKVLTNPDNITHVWKGGKAFKAPRFPSWAE